MIPLTITVSQEPVPREPVHLGVKPILTSILLMIALLIGSCGVRQDTTQQPVDLTKIENRIMDSAFLLTGNEELQLYEMVRSFEKELGPQVAVLTTGRLKGSSIEQFSLAIAERMRFGRPQINDGILITVVSDERKMRIEVGYGLEKIIRDEIAARILREDIAPKFKEEKYFEGLSSGVRKITELIEANRGLIGQYP